MWVGVGVVVGSARVDSYRGRMGKSCRLLRMVLWVRSVGGAGASLFR